MFVSVICNSSPTILVQGRKRKGRFAGRVDPKHTSRALAVYQDRKVKSEWALSLCLRGSESAGDKQACKLAIRAQQDQGYHGLVLKTLRIHQTSMVRKRIPILSRKSGIYTKAPSPKTIWHIQVG